MISSPKRKTKICKQISTSISLQIEFDEHQKPISLKLINTDHEINQSKPSNEPKRSSKDESIHLPLSEELNKIRSPKHLNNLNQSITSPIKSINKIEGNYRGLHKFIARHDDEISIEIGDSIYVIKQEDDLWFKGSYHFLFPV